MNRFTTTALGALAILLGASLPIAAKVVRPAPDFSISQINGSLAKSFKGQSVVLLVAESPRSRAFRKQVKLLERKYRYFAGRDVVFVAAFTSEDGVIKSDIPFVTADNPTSVAAAYGIEEGGFGIAIIAPDGNLDMVSSEVTSGEGVLVIVENTYVVQAASQKNE